MRRASEVLLTLDERPESGSRQQWLYKALCDAMRDGRLPPGSRVPTSRSLARDHGLSRSTVTLVFERLIADGYIHAQVGRGSFVTDRPVANASPTVAPEAPPFAHPPLLSHRGRALALNRRRIEPAWPQTFLPDCGDTSLFPVETWTRLAMQRERWRNPHWLLPGDVQGLRPLREALARHLSVARGLPCSADRLVIVGSAGQGLDLLARLLLDPGDAVWIEDPGLCHRHVLFEAASAQLVAVPVDHDGLDVAAGAQLAPYARLVHLSGAVLRPLGVPLAPARRRALLDWAEACQAYVIEEEHEADFVLGNLAVPSLRAVAGADTRVIQVGGLAHSLFPGLQLAYLLLPDALLEPVCAALAATGQQPSAQEQQLLLDFIEQGGLARHLRELRERYASRAATLQSSLDRHFGEWLRFAPVRQGLSLTAFLPDPVDAVRISSRAAGMGITVTPLSAYRVRHPVPQGVRLGFAAFAEASIRAGIEKLAATLLERIGRSEPR